MRDTCFGGDFFKVPIKFPTFIVWVLHIRCVPPTRWRILGGRELTDGLSFEGGSSHEEYCGSLFGGRIVRCANKVPHQLEVGRIIAWTISPLV